MTDAKLRVGVAGAGHFGRYHALKVAASSRTRLSGIYDPHLERAKTLGWEAGAKEMDFEALLAASDALIVAAPARGPSRSGVAGAAGGQACAGGKADRCDAGAGGRTGGAGEATRAGAAGRAPGAVLRCLSGDGGQDRGAAVHRGNADRAVQAARHGCFGDPRSDDPRSRSGAGPGGQRDRERRCRRRPGRQSA